MSKTLVANPVATGFTKFPPKIILDSGSLTVKTGLVFTDNKTFPYSKISDVTYSGVGALSSLIIIPDRGEAIKLFGFSRSQYNIIKKAVGDGYYEGDDDDEQPKSHGSRQNNSIKQVVGGGYDDDDDEDNDDDEEPIMDSEGEAILSMDVDVTNEGELVKSLNSLIATIETKGERNKDVNDAGIAKYKNFLAILKTTHPQNKLIPYFSSKVTEWAEKAKKEEQETMRLLKKLLKWGFILFAVGAIIAIIGSIFG